MPQVKLHVLHRNRIKQTDSNYHSARQATPMPQSSRMYWTYHFTKCNTRILLLDPSSVGVRVQEECTLITLRLIRIFALLSSLLLGYGYIFFITDVLVSDAFYVRTHDFYLTMLVFRTKVLDGIEHDREMFCNVRFYGTARRVKNQNEKFRIFKKRPSELFPFYF